MPTPPGESEKKALILLDIYYVKHEKYKKHNRNSVWIHTQTTEPPSHEEEIRKRPPKYTAEQEKGH